MRTLVWSASFVRAFKRGLRRQPELRARIERTLKQLAEDPFHPTLYISFKKGPTEVTTIRLTEDIAVDLGPGEEIIGIEILDASDHLAFTHATIDMKANWKKYREDFERGER